jgi:carotenoid cleavage dioxygenase-like enzyme
MTESFAPDVYRVFLPWHQRIVQEPALLHGAGKVYSQVDRNFTGERVMLPLSEDGETGDGILGATVYLASAGVGAATSFDSEKLDFYPVD